MNNTNIQDSIHTIYLLHLFLILTIYTDVTKHN